MAGNSEQLDRLLSLRETAEYLGVTEHTIYQWRYQGTGPTGLKVGGRVRYRLSEIEAWLDANADSRPNPAA